MRNGFRMCILLSDIDVLVCLLNSSAGAECATFYVKRYMQCSHVSAVSYAKNACLHLVTHGESGNQLNMTKHRHKYPLHLLCSKYMIRESYLCRKWHCQHVAIQYMSTEMARLHAHRTLQGCTWLRVPGSLQQSLCRICFSITVLLHLTCFICFT